MAYWWGANIVPKSQELEIVFNKHL